MRNSLKYGAALLLLTLCMCGGSARVKHAPESLLSSARVVAVTDMQVTSTSGANLIGELVVQTSKAVFGNERITEDFEARFRESLISTANRNLLEKGFAPIQRVRIREVEAEMAYQQSGLTGGNSVKLGRLLNANAVFTGQLSIRREEGIDYPLIVACLFPAILIIPRSEAEVAFSGELTHVETGALLASGVSSATMRKVSAEEIDSVIEAWFDELPDF